MTESIQGANENLTFSEILKDAFEHRIADLHTCLPGKIDSYDPDTGFAKVQIQIKRVRLNQEDPVDFPLLSDVPVWQFRSGNAFVHVPVSAGDFCLVFFFERSIEKFLSSFGTPVDPEDVRKHNLSDCFCLPGEIRPAKSIKSQFGIDPDELFVKNENMIARLLKSGKTSLENATGEILDALSKIIKNQDDLIAALQTATVATAIGPQPLDAATQATLNSLRTTNATEKTIFDSFKV